MLDSTDSIKIAILAGKNDPNPVSHDVAAAFTYLEVNNNDDTEDGFQMTFNLSKDARGDYSLLHTNELNQNNRLVIRVNIGMSTETLIDGVITNQQIAPSNDPGKGTLVITGKDISCLLDDEEMNEPHESQKDSDSVRKLIADSKIDFEPQIEETSEQPDPTKRVPFRHGTRLEYIKHLAEQNSFVFFVEPISINHTIAYWGPKNRSGPAQKPLKIDSGHATNLKSIYFRQDGLAPVRAEGMFIDPITKRSWPLPPTEGLKLTGLAANPTPVTRRTLTRQTANKNPGQAALAALAAEEAGAASVVGQGEIDTLRYGRLLRARKKVELHGAGRSFDGEYDVTRVTHSIQKGRYSQTFTISRDGTN